MEIVSHKEVVYGSKVIPYTHFYSERKTIEVAVNPDCSVTVKSPIDADDEYIDARVKKRARWILKQFNYFKQFQPRTTERHYISGETHQYLGRKYRLKVMDGENESVKCTRGFFLVTVQGCSPERVQKLMDNWYREKAEKTFSTSLERGYKLMKSDSNKPNIMIRKMKSRWGSLSQNGCLTLNLELIKAPQECIDYVVIHELCHTRFYHHGPEFYEFLSEVLSDWEKRKHKLELSVCIG